ncbi:MAG: hypothetical protein KJ077_19895 [Anaerolineae bacterium]|nr:hypothetical protein [Anaerolineae bacterium]
MAEQNGLERLNFFTGFFTTAQDWQAEQAYHRQKLEFHNCWLHKPGIIRSFEKELQVIAAGGLKVKVEPGAALDYRGREIYLSQSPPELDIGKDLDLKGDSAKIVYIAIKYYEEKTDYVENVTQPQYSGHTRIVERPHLKATLSEPKKPWVELARIKLQPDATEISNPLDPHNPKDNEIDRSQVAWAGAVGVTEEQLPLEMRELLTQVMRRTRQAFAALDGRFPIPSASDVRHAALTAELLAGTGGLRPGRWLPLIKVLAAIEQDVAQELDQRHGRVLNTIPEFLAFETAVQELQGTLPSGDEDGILTKQDAVAEAVRELSGIADQSPIADAGRDQIVATSKDEATVTLDGSKSRGRGGRKIECYYWQIRRKQPKGVWKMAYSIYDFPITVNDPTIDVDLPEGTYRFELVVEDSAGLKSTPHQVTITVKREVKLEPEITGITPRFGLRGVTVEGVKIQGKNLQDAYEVLFWPVSGTGPDPRLEAIIQAGATDEELPLSIFIKSNADFGEYTYTVRTPGGEAGSPANKDKIFHVVGHPEIIDVKPLHAHQGEKFETVVLITGNHLFLGSDLAKDHKVEFLYGSTLNQAITAKITEEKSTYRQLEVNVMVGEDNKLFGEHIIEVTTPAGKVQSPPQMKFKVEGPRPQAKAS